MQTFPPIEGFTEQNAKFSRRSPGLVGFISNRWFKNTCSCNAVNCLSSEPTSRSVNKLHNRSPSLRGFGYFKGFKFETQLRFVAFSLRHGRILFPCFLNMLFLSQICNHFIFIMRPCVERHTKNRNCVCSLSPRDTPTHFSWRSWLE